MALRWTMHRYGLQLAPPIVTAPVHKSREPGGVEGGSAASDHRPMSRLAHMTKPQVARYVKMLVTCNMLQDDRSFILLVQERDGQFSWPGGKADEGDHNAFYAASRELLEEASLVITPLEWEVIGGEVHDLLGTCVAFACTLARRTLPLLRTEPDHHTLQAQWVPSSEALYRMLTPGLMRFDDMGMPFSDYLQARHPVPWARCKAGLRPCLHEDGQYLWTPVDQVE